MAILPRDAGVLFVGHGTRHEAGREALLTLAKQVAHRLAPVPLEPAFLELAEPTIGEALERLVARGAREIVVAPLLLFAAGHAKQDVPIAIEAAQCQHRLPALRIRQAGHLGLHPAVVELSRQRFTEALQRRQSASRENTCLLLVGRGSSDPEAIAEMHELACRRAEDPDIGQCRVAFVAIARPSVAESLAQLAKEGWQRVIVQPHLLFPGEVLDSVQAEVHSVAANHPRQQWIIAPHLGVGLEAGRAQDLLVRAVVGRIREIFTPLP